MVQHTVRSSAHNRAHVYQHSPKQGKRKGKHRGKGKKRIENCQKSVPQLIHIGQGNIEDKAEKTLANLRSFPVHCAFYRIRRNHETVSIDFCPDGHSKRRYACRLRLKR